MSNMEFEFQRWLRGFFVCFFAEGGYLSSGPFVCCPLLHCLPHLIIIVHRGAPPKTSKQTRSFEENEWPTNSRTWSPTRQTGIVRSVSSYGMVACHLVSSHAPAREPPSKIHGTRNFSRWHERFPSYDKRPPHPFHPIFDSYVKAFGLWYNDVHSS